MSSEPPTTRQQTGNDSMEKSHLLPDSLGLEMTSIMFFCIPFMKTIIDTKPHLDARETGKCHLVE